MIKPIVSLFLFLPVLIFGQIEKLELGILIGNNGQLESTLNDFYVADYLNLKEPIKYNNAIPNIKYSASARYFFKENISIRMKLGKVIRKDIHSQGSTTGRWDFDIRQSLVNFSPAVSFSKRLEKFELCTGLELPFIRVNDFFVNSYRYDLNNMNSTLGAIYKTTSKGGLIYGFNNFIELKYHFTSRISLGAEIKYGLLFAKLGGSYSVLSKVNADPNAPYSRYSEIEKKYKRTFFSPPEVSFGIFIQLGRNKIKT